MLTINIDLPTFLEDKYSLLKVMAGSNIHQSFLIDDKVVVYENTVADNPAGALMVFKDITDYISSIKDTDWLNNVNTVIQSGMELKQLGYPFK